MKPERADLNMRWAALTAPDDATLDGTRVRAGAGPLAYLAVDSASVRHLLLEVDYDAHLPTRLPRGLAVRAREVGVRSSPATPWMDLSCPNESDHDTFTALAQELIETLPDRPRDVAGHVASTLARWRWFWSAESNRLVNGGALGLFGELWFLLRWLGPVTPAALRSWRGPLGGRHDFVTPTISTEVKTTTGRAAGGPVHRINTLEQLEDPEVGKLHLFSLLLARDPLAAHSLTGLVEQLLGAVQSSVEATSLATERLAAAGWSPTHAEDYRGTYRVLTEELYDVHGEFPRLTRDTIGYLLPDGVGDVSYSPSLAACRPWRIPAARGLRRGGAGGLTR